MNDKCGSWNLPSSGRCRRQSRHNRGIGAKPILHFSLENPLRINESAFRNPTGLKRAYTDAVSCREADGSNSQSVQEMWFECDAEEVRENRRRSFEERKRNSKAPAGNVVVQLHIDRERRLGAKSARDTQRRKDRSGGDPARRTVSADRTDEASVIEAFVGLSALTHGPSRLCRNAPESSPVAKQITRGAHQAPTPTTNFCARFVRAPLSRF